MKFDKRSIAKIIALVMMIFVLYYKVIFHLGLPIYHNGAIFEIPNMHSVLRNFGYHFLFTVLSTYGFSEKTGIIMSICMILLIPLQILLDIGAPTVYILAIAVLASALGFIFKRRAIRSYYPSAE